MRTRQFSCRIETLQDRRLMAADFAMAAESASTTTAETASLSGDRLELEIAQAVENNMEVSEGTDPCADLEEQLSTLIEDGTLERYEGILTSALKSIQGGNYDLAATRIRNIAKVQTDSAIRAQLFEMAGTGFACNEYHVSAATNFVRAADDLESLLDSAPEEERESLRARIRSLYLRAADQYGQEHERTYQRRAEEARENADRFADS